MTRAKPYLIEFKKIGSPGLGYISIAEKEQLLFPIKRVYWTYYTPEEVKRGGHAHYELEQILLAVSGRINVYTELLNGEKTTFILERPNMGLYIPRLCWREMQYSHNAVQVCLASMEYDEKEYIRDYPTFQRLKTA